MKKLLFLFLFLALTACQTINPSSELSLFTHSKIKGKTTNISLWSKNIQPQSRVRIYIDGNADKNEKNEARIQNPIALKLAKKDKYPHIIYMARPCFFSEDTVCSSAVWSEGQYMPEVIDEMKIVLDKLQKKYKLSEVEIVGYDGGAAIALLLASRVKTMKIDVITVAGIVDTQQSALLADIELNEHSLNPAKEPLSMSTIKQIHYVGLKDKTVSPIITRDFLKRLPNPYSIQMKALPNADHDNWDRFKLDFIYR